MWKLFVYMLPISRKMIGFTFARVGERNPSILQISRTLKLHEDSERSRIFGTQWNDRDRKPRTALRDL